MVQSVEQQVPSSFAIKVNGEEITTHHQKMVAHDILELAEKVGAIPGKPESYTLQGEQAPYGWDDWVDLSEDKQFITIPNTPPQVA